MTSLISSRQETKNSHLENFKWNSQTVLVAAGVVALSIAVIYHREISSYFEMKDQGVSFQMVAPNFYSSPSKFISIQELPELICSQAQEFLKNGCVAENTVNSACETVADLCKDLPSDFDEFSEIIINKHAVFENNQGSSLHYLANVRFKFGERVCDAHGIRFENVFSSIKDCIKLLNL